MILGHADEGFVPGAAGGAVNQFYSLHRDEDFLFADCHVAFLAADMDYKSYRAMATHAGGETENE
jgi:hypothetical protein